MPVSKITTSSIDALGYGFKNRLINGAMMIDQRNAGASVTQTTGVVYPVDRFYINGTVTSKFTAQQNAGSVTPPAGFTKYLGCTSSAATSLGATDYYVLRQNIEGLNVSDLGWGSANAQPVTLSFRVYSSLTGTFGGHVFNAAANRFYVFSYTISSANTWTTISATIPGDTTGTWATDNTTGMYVGWSLGTGSTYSGTAGSWGSSILFAPTGATSVVGTNGATFYITGVQLEVGSTATSFDYRPYGTELQLCQRYFQKTWGLAGDYVTIGGAGIVTSGTGAARVQIPLFTPMRTSPTADILSTSVYDAGVVAAVTAVTATHSTPTSFSFDLAASGGGLTQFRPAIFLINVGTSNYVSLSAEL